MRAYAYQGDHAEVTLYGVIFPRGVCVPVDNPVLLAKLSGNSHFVEGQLPPDMIKETTPKRRGRPPKA
jgi:hypothetical protein